MASEKNNFVNDGFLEYAYVLDQTYSIKLIIDQFTDFLWIERYNRSGEFEMTVPVSIPVVQGCRLNDYLAIRESDNYMVIESLTVEANMMKIAGRTLDSILDRRIIWGELTLKKIGVQAAIKQMMDENAINPSNTKRQIPGLSFKESDDEAITSLVREEISSEGGNLYSEIQSICADEDLGFRMTPKGEGGFEFELYFGTDRSWDQDALPWVVFSDSYENLKSSRYLQSEKNYKSTACIKQGEGQYAEVFRKTERVGLARREIFLSGGSDKTKDELVEYAKDELKEYLVDKLFDGETEPSRQFVYGKDYFLGDIVQLENKYGQKGRCRITEVERSRDASGPSLVPTFEAVEDDDEESGGDD